MTSRRGFILTSRRGHILHVTGPLSEITSGGCFVGCKSEHSVEQTIRLSMTEMLCHSLAQASRWIMTIEIFKDIALDFKTAADILALQYNHIAPLHRLGLRTSHAFIHDDVIKWIYFPRYCPFVWGNHRSPVNSPHKSQWRRALMFFFCSWIYDWVNNHEAGDLRCRCANYDVTIMI